MNKLLSRRRERHIEGTRGDLAAPQTNRRAGARVHGASICSGRRRAHSLIHTHGGPPHHHHQHPPPALRRHPGNFYSQTNQDPGDRRLKWHVQEEQEQSAGGLRVRGGRHELAPSSLLPGMSGKGWLHYHCLAHAGEECQQIKLILDHSKMSR